MGLYLALTGYTCNVVDAFFVGFLTHIIPRSLWQHVKEELADCDWKKIYEKFPTIDSGISMILNTYHDVYMQEKPIAIQQSYLYQNQQRIAKFFNDSKQSLQEILTDLEEEVANPNQEDSEFATQCLHTLQKLSPISLNLSFLVFRLVKNEKPKPTIECALQLEYRVMVHLFANKGEF